MADGPTQDKDFLAAKPEDQHAYLMATDSDYAAAAPEDQKAYLTHVTHPANSENLPGSTPRLQESVNKGVAPMKPPAQFEKDRPVPSNQEREAGEFDLGALSTASGLPEHFGKSGTSHLDYLKDAITEPPAKPSTGDVLGESLLGPAYGLGKSIYGMGKSILAPSGEGEDAAMERAHGAGQAAGMVLPAAIGEGVEGTGENIRKNISNRRELGRIAGGTQKMQELLAPGGTKAGQQVADIETIRRTAPYIAEQEREHPVLSTQPSGTPLEGQRLGVMTLKQNVDTAAKNLFEKTIQPRQKFHANNAINGMAVANDIRSTINPNSMTDAAKAGKINDAADFYGNTRTVGEALKKIAALNDDKQLQSYHSALPEKQIEILGANPEIEAKLKAVNSLRNQVFDSIERYGTPEEANHIRETRKDLAALMDLSGKLENTKVPTPEGFMTRLGNTVKLAMSAKAGFPGAVGNLDTLFRTHDPNTLAEASSGLFGKTGLAPKQPPPINTSLFNAPPPSAGALPSPAVQAGFTPPADASGSVRGGRWTTPAAQLPPPAPHGLLPPIGGLTPRGVAMPLPGTAEVAHPNLFQNPLHTEVGPQPLGRITGHTAEGGPIRENPPQLGQIAPEAKPGQLGKIKSFQPSEKAATMSAPRKVVPEQEGHNFDEQLQLAKKIVGDPNATAEEKRVAQGRIDQSEEVQKNYRKKPAE